MSVQIFLQGKPLEFEEFLMAPWPRTEHRSGAFLRRSHWTSLLAEAVLPRALLSELGVWRASCLVPVAEASFFLVLPEESRDTADQFLTLAALDNRGNERQPVEADLEHHGKPGRLE